TYCCMEKNFCYLCNTEGSTISCPKCERPTCKRCMKSFPFSEDLCLECASTVKTGLAGLRKDEEIF
ncbi:MAG: hypothetical protein ACHQXG_05225, partial [Nitrososphaerales archaeon]